MGVSLGELVKPETISFERLAGKRIAIDAHNTLYQFLSSIRDRFTGEPLRDSSGRVTSHLSGLFYRMGRLVEAGIEPVFVFDGKPPDFKKDTIDARRRVKEQAQVRWTKALEEGDTEGARIAASQTSRLTSEMIEESKRLLGYMGIGWVQAPSEGEAQAAYMVSKGQVYASCSQDWDSLLFGTPLLVKNLTVSGKRKVAGKEAYVNVEPELIELSKVLAALGIDREQLIMLGILVGTDFDPGGISGIGPKKALALVKECKSMERVLERVDWRFDISFEKIFEFFINPPAQDIEIMKGKLDTAKVREMLMERGFSAERIDGTLKKLSAKPAVAGLSKFFGKA